MSTADYEGRCHCGAIGFRYVTAVPPADWSVRACQCRFCRAHDALSTSDPDGDLEFFADGPEHLGRYRFSLGTADFLFCRNCGVYIGAIIDTDDGTFGIVNTHALVDAPDDMAATVPIVYDGEETDGRVARRSARWTPARERHDH